MTYFIEASVIVGGALDSYETFYTFSEFEEWLENVKPELSTLDYGAEVYVLEHEHALEPECECVQYLTDHLPYWSNGLEDY